MSGVIEKMIDQTVLVRSGQSGVWVGTLQAVWPGATGTDVMLSGASKIHYWEGAEATSGLAIRGPGDGSRVCEEVDTVLVSGCCEVILAAAPCIKRMGEVKRWRV